MKTILVLVIGALTSAVVAVPPPINVPGLVAREQCWHPSECSWFNSGQCEEHCDGYGGFMYMQGCGWARKRCCCAEKTE